jgi:hypothetical protein
MTRAHILAALLLFACAPDERDGAAPDASPAPTPLPKEEAAWVNDVEPGVGPDCAAPAGCEQDRECAWCARGEWSARAARRAEGEACLWETAYTTASDGAQEWWDWCELLRDPPP